MTPASAKAKGRNAEKAVVATLARNGWPHAERRRQEGSNDRGDITGIPGVVIEVKNHRQINLAEFVDQAETEATNADASVGVAWIKRRGTTDAADWYVAMTGGQFMQLLREAGY